MSFQKCLIYCCILTAALVIFIIIFDSFSNTAYAVAIAANPNVNENINKYYNRCLFSVIICLNNLSQQQEVEEKADEEFISSDIEQVNSTKLKKWVDVLSSFHTRHTKSEYIEKAAYWLKDELKNICKGKVYFHNFTQTDERGRNYHLKNVICDKKDSSADDDNNLIIISAHYDSRMQDINNTDARAPGADDNASGVSAILELARVLSRINLENRIQFVLFSGEEQGQWGSSEYVKYLHNNNKNTNLLLFINLDMVGYPPQGLNKIIIEQDLGNKVPTNDIYSRAIGEFVKQIALKYTNLEPTLATIGKSDYTPFEAFGHTVIGVHDGGAEQNPNYHRSSDTPDTLDIEYLALVTKLVLATILNLDEFGQ